MTSFPNGGWWVSRWGVAVVVMVVLCLGRGAVTVAAPAPVSRSEALLATAKRLFADLSAAI
jgi:hypothetical protein